MADWDIRPSDPLPEHEPLVRETPTEITVRRSRRAVTVLRVVAGATAVAGLISQYGVTYVSDDRFGPDTSGSDKFFNFLQGMIFPLVWAGLVFAAAAVVDIMTSRLVADQRVAGGDHPRRADTAGDLVVNAPGRPLLAHQPTSPPPAQIDDTIWQPPIPTD